MAVTTRKVGIKWVKSNMLLEVAMPKLVFTLQPGLNGLLEKLREGYILGQSIMASLMEVVSRTVFLLLLGSNSLLVLNRGGVLKGLFSFF